MKTAVVTGCSSGIGQILTQKLLKKGWYVIATMRRADERKEIFKEELKLYKNQLVIKALDVTHEQERNEVTEFIGRNYKKGVDLLVNNAGYGLFGLFEESSEKQIRHQMEVNFFGALLLTKSLLPEIHKASGRIVNVSSGFAIIGFPLTSVYCASKFALDGWSESLHFELAPHNIKVNLIQPGAQRTQFAQNVNWADEGSPLNSLYTLQTQNYKNLLSKLSSRKNGPQPERVVERILKLSEGDANPLRVQVGSDSKMIKYLKRTTPQSIYQFVFSSFNNKVFLKDH